MYWVGGILRDSTGAFVAAYANPVSGVFSAAMAEVLGLEYALKMILQHGWSRVNIEMDAEAVVRDFLSVPEDRSEFGSVIESCRCLFAHCNDVIVSFNYRSANQVPHSIASASLSLVAPVFWLEEPANLRSLLIADVIALH